MKNLNFLFFATAILFGGCGSDDGANKPDTGPGNVLVINEGNFSQSNGSITAYNPQSDEVTENLFESVNGRPLGDVVQSLFIDSGEAGYIVVNNSRKIEVVNAFDFTSTATIDAGLANPRYLLRHGDQLFVSNWGNFDANFQLDQSYVLILDALTFEEEGMVETQVGTENLAYSNGFLYASNSFTNSVSVINVATGTLSATLETGFSPGEMVVGNSGEVWLICGGSYQGNDGAIYQLNADDAQLEIELGVNPVARLALDTEASILYFLTHNSVGSYTIGEGTLSTDFIENDEAVGFWGLGFNAAEGVLYVSDAKAFQGKGEVYRYSKEGELLPGFEAGVGPNGFVFRTE